MLREIDGLTIMKLGESLADAANCSVSRVKDGRASQTTSKLEYLSRGGGEKVQNLHNGAKPKIAHHFLKVWLSRKAQYTTEKVLSSLDPYYMRVQWKHLFMPCV